MNENERMRVSVPISGIDTSTPDEIVADGKCESLYNMRYANGTWRNVNDISMESTFETEWPIEIIYKHPAAGDSTYIATITEQNYAIFKEPTTGRLLYLEPRKDSGLVNVFSKDFDIYIPETGIKVKYDAASNTYIQTQELTTDVSIGAYDEVGGTGEFQYLTLNDRPTVGNVLYEEFLGDGGVINEIGVITRVRRQPGINTGFIYDIAINGNNTKSLIFKGTVQKNIPNGIQKPISVIPPASVISINVQDSIPQVLCQYDPYQKLKINHFGNTLFINRPNLTTFVLRDGKYYYTDFSRIHFLCNEKKQGAGIDDSFTSNGIAIPQDFKDDTLAEFITGSIEYYPLAPKSRDTLLYKTFDGDSWRGEICYFLAARMDDGAVVAVSPLFIHGDNPSKSVPIVIQTYNGEKIYCLYKGADALNNNNINNLKPEQLANQHPMAGGWCSVEFTMTTDNDNPLISDIALYSTRIMPTFDLTKIVAIDDETWNKTDSLTIQGGGDAFTDTSKAIANEPFYLVDTISWTDYKKNGKRSFDLTYTKLKDIIGNAVFQPNNNIAPIINFSAYREYNSCAHFGGVERTIPKGFVYRDEMIRGGGGIRFEPSYNILYDGYRPSYPDDDRDYETDFDESLDGGYDDGGYDDGGIDDYAMQNAVTTSNEYIKDIIVRIKRNNRKLYSVTKDINQDTNIWSICKIISYPDASAESIMFATGTSQGYQGVECALSPANAINFAFFIPSSYRKFDPEWTPNNPEEVRTTILKDIIEDALFVEHNKLIVSQTNNNFKLPFERTYNIGSDSNKIMAINSGAIEMSDAKFGEIPLYIFSDEGIFAMQSGQDNVLYSTVIPINYDRIINPQTLAVNYNIIYITREGIKALSAQTTSLLSEAINGPDNKPLLDYLQDANLYHHKPYNELIVHKPSSTSAYIYAIDGGSWSQRELMGSRLDAERIYQYRLLSGKTLHNIFSLALHEGTKVPAISITTRPLKFGSHEFKRLETFIARMRACPEAEIFIWLYGSNDRVTWAPLRELLVSGANVDIALRRFPFSARYIRVEIDCDISAIDNAYFEISSMDMEYYLRFLHRLR